MRARMCLCVGMTEGDSRGSNFSILANINPGKANNSEIGSLVHKYFREIWF